MNKINRFIWRLPMLVGYGAIILSMLACAVLTGGEQTQEGTLRLDEGVIKVKMDTGEWVPVAGKATFALVGKLENTEPWTVAGKTLVTNESTEIDEGLQVGDIVRVSGTLLEDDTWVAYSIERTDEQTDPIVVLIGVVDSVDPWVVNGIQLAVTDETEIEDEIKPGMIVRVSILLLDDGTWEVLRISPLGEETGKPGCVNVVATIVNVSGDQIQFLGWPDSVTFAPDEQSGNENDEDELSLNPGDTVSAVVCTSEDGLLVIAWIIILDRDEEGGSTTPGERVLVCHKPDKKGGHTLSLPQSAVPAHLGHGDTLGPCP